MRLSRIAAATVLSLGLSVAGAEAMTIARPLPLAGSDAPAVTLTAGGCGIGFHRGPYGGCRPNGFGYGGWRGGYGWHRGWGWHRHYWHRW